MKNSPRSNLVFCVGLIVCAVLVGAVAAVRHSLAMKKLGYCFDAAFDERRNRLFTAGGAAGLHLLDVSEGTLRYVSTYDDGGYARNLQLWNGRAYIADTDRGLVVLDISGDSPVTVWEQGASVGMGIYVDGNRAYLAAGHDGLCIFELTNPDRPKLLGRTKTAGSAWDVWVHDGYAYVADCDQGVTVVDVSSGEQPLRVGFVTRDAVSPLAEIVRGEDDAVYVAAAYHGLVAIDVSDPTDPIVVSVHRLAPDSWAEGLAVREGLLYLVVGNERHGGENGLHILDAHDLYAISTIGKLHFPDWVEGVHVAGDLAFVANTWSGARSIDVQDPDIPLLVDSFTLGGWMMRHLRSTLRLN
jgi:hypothetical protein